MGKSNLKYKSILYMLALLLIVQSCVVYKKTPVSLEQAKIANQKTLVTTVDKVKYKFNRILLIDGMYYGEIKKGNKYEMVLLNETDIKNIRPIDKTASTLGNIAIIVGTVGTVILIVALIELSQWDLGGDWGNGAF